MKFKLTIEINMDNDAFKENEGELDEILRLYVANHYHVHHMREDAVKLVDSNGNTVGTAFSEVIDA